jgi:hypothetical protein
MPDKNKDRDTQPKAASKAEQVEKETGQDTGQPGDEIKVPESGLDPTMPPEGYTGPGAPVNTFPHLNPDVPPYPAERREPEPEPRPRRPPPPRRRRPRPPGPRPRRRRLPTRSNRDAATVEGRVEGRGPDVSRTGGPRPAFIPRACR